MSMDWRDGNSVRLLENGEEFFPRVFDAIRAARRSVMVETFILFEDKVGRQLRDCLVAAAMAGASVDLMVDGYGSPSFSAAYLDSLIDAGVRVRVFDPRRRLLGMRTNLFRRLHRKIAVVDDEVAFVGGINYSADHLADFGPDAKQDYSVELRGPVVADIARSCHALIASRRGRWRRFLGRWNTRDSASAAPAAGRSGAAFVARDNGRHRSDIERQYRIGIRAARKRVVIANAYFLPGYRLLRTLRKAARRGVSVRLILQGQPDMPLVTAATRSLYHYLLPAGVEIFEYCERPFHGKVALVDDEWSTVGSSNLDPLSLWFNLEANVIVRDRAFADELSASLERLARHHCRRVGADDPSPRWSLRPLFGVMLFHFLRHFPRYLGKPSRPPRILGIERPQTDAAELDVAAFATAEADDTGAAGAQRIGIEGRGKQARGKPPEVERRRA